MVLELAFIGPSFSNTLLWGSLSMLEFLTGDEETDSIGEVFATLEFCFFFCESEAFEELEVTAVV
jgi:hypothetical protein